MVECELYMGLSIVVVLQVYRDVIGSITARV